MLQFLLAFVLATTVYRESPPAVGVGGSPQEAKTHIEFLDTCAQLTWTTAQRLDKGLVFQISGRYTICKSTLSGGSFLVCLVGIDLTVGAIKAGVASLLAEYNKVFDKQGKLTDYATQTCKPYDHQPVIEPVVSAAPANAVVHDVSSQIQSTSVAPLTPKRMARSADWPAPEFAGGRFDVAATLNGFFKPAASAPHSLGDHRVYASPVTLDQFPVFNNPVQCVGLWGENLDLWIVMTSESALRLKDKLGDETEASIHTEQKHCFIIPAAKARVFMQILSGKEDDETIAWMKKDPKHHFQGRIDCRPKSSENSR